METFLFKNNVLENYAGNKKSKDTYMHTINSSKSCFDFSSVCEETFR